ncbi:GIY-YIG nuclease family protein [Flavivirga sp. 57AJ16]|uniref:GIY-YIG nuclease family protein n=1 Tax=Flavivirga sp. 57AJ16 TaxID=3025307 RepID=UPI002365C3BB|nr:GIY-YIG nuclease family protein [Flavivirga sp. 57AJ16]MDD7884737.1 GIY-YIG nuclease family protein [Flavivirga sp. 57AJ16]
MFYVYAISSLNKNYIYVGLTQNLEARIERHNQKREKTTRAYVTFQLIYSEQTETRIEARKREKYWKSGIGKEKLRLIRDKS